MRHLVVARYNESIEWIHNLNLPDNVKVFVYNKGNELNAALNNWEIINLPNVGQCWGSFMYHIKENWGNYAESTIFTTACIENHQKKKKAFKILLDKVLRKKLNTVIPLKKRTYNLNEFSLDDWESQTPQNRGGKYTQSEVRPLGKWKDKHFPDVSLPYFCKTSYYSIFAVSKEELMKYPKLKYEAIYSELNRSELQEEAHFLERIIPFIWKEESSNNIILIFLSILLIIIVIKWILYKT